MQGRQKAEPLLGCVELPLHELTQDNLCTQWHPLRAQGQRGEDILGEARRQALAKRGGLTKKEMMATQDLVIAAVRYWDLRDLVIGVLDAVTTE